MEKEPENAAQAVCGNADHPDPREARRGGPTADFCRKHGMSNANFWRAKLRPLVPLLSACAVVICYVATNEGGLEGGLTLPASAQSPALSRGGLAQLQSSVLGRAPIVRIL